jgi:hypothetical protein
MKNILVLILITLIHSTCFADEYGDLPKNIIPQGYRLAHLIPVDINGDGLYDYLAVLEEKKNEPNGQNITSNQYPVLLLIRQPDESFKLLERNSITVSCANCFYGYTIESFATPPLLTSWVSYADGSRSRVYVPIEISSFAEKGYRIIEWISSDLNGDGLDDYLVAIEKQQKEILGEKDPEIGVDSAHRSVLIIIRQPDKSLKLVKRNDFVASCTTCFDFYTDDSFAQIIAAQRTFSIRRESRGTAFLNIFTYTFGYSRRDNTWQLIRVEEKYEAQTSRDESFVKIYTPPKDFGKIDFANFDPDSYQEKGEGYQPPKQKKRH